MTTSTLSPFFRLPQELRDQIYDNLLTTAYFPHLRSGNLSFSLSYCNPTPTFQTRNNHYDGRWLLTNHSILTEATQQLYTKAICTSCTRIPILDNKVKPAATPVVYPIFDITKVRSVHHAMIQLDAALDMHGNGELWAVRDHSQGCDEDTSNDRLACTPSWLRPASFALVTGGQGIVVLPDWAGSASTRGVLRDAPALGPLVEELRGFTSHALRELVCGFILPEEMHPWRELCMVDDRNEDELARDVKMWAVDMSYLEKLGCGLERVQFYTDVEVWRVRRRSEDALYADVFERIQEEMMHVGKRLVGGSGCGSGEGWAMRDWVERDKKNERMVTWHIEVLRGKAGECGGELKYKGLGSFERLFVGVDTYHCMLFD
jgi:hypothetical protein